MIAPITKIIFMVLAALTLLIIAAGCSHDDPPQIEIGQTREEIIDAVGDPDEITEFTIPDTPYFGPQEGLASLLPAGTIVEEWQFSADGEVTYVWFGAKSSEPRKQWTAVHTATFPADAVF